MAERAGLSRATISKIEKGDPTASMGAYGSVLFVLGLADRLNELADAAHDLTGRQLEEEKLPKRVRLPKKKKQIRPALELTEGAFHAAASVFGAIGDSAPDRWGRVLM